MSFQIPTSSPATRTLIASAAIALFAVLAPAASEARAKNDIKLSFEGHNAPIEVGERTCFAGRVTNSRGRSVGNARVILGGKTVRTGDDGRFEVCGKLDYAGEHTVFAFKGEKRDHATLKAGSGVAGGEWRKVDVLLRAYDGGDGTGECSHGFITRDVFGEDTGHCNALAEDGEGPFAGKRTQLDWFEQSNGRLRIDIYAGAMTLRGWMPSRASGNLFITASNSWPGGAVTGGSDVARAGQPGGPFSIDVTHWLRSVGEGYKIEASGWVVGK